MQSDERVISTSWTLALHLEHISVGLLSLHPALFLFCVFIYLSLPLLFHLAPSRLASLLLPSLSAFTSLKHVHVSPPNSSPQHAAAPMHHLTSTEGRGWRVKRGGEMRRCVGMEWWEAKSKEQ
mmetsp:Transcript_33912/g.87063  ORF Transcript_33912/g.87063 Transcript_33912/m.87063 type:complete len:123 (-) Transcript_33912:88-456(-)